MGLRVLQSCPFWTSVIFGGPFSSSDHSIQTCASFFDRTRHRRERTSGTQLASTQIKQNGETLQHALVVVSLKRSGAIKTNPRFAIC